MSDPLPSQGMPSKGEGPSKVLVIDDSLVCRMQIKKYLQHIGLEVIELPGGTEALQTAKEQMPDLIITDVQMPKIDRKSVV